MSGLFWIVVAWVVINVIARAVKAAQSGVPGQRPQPGGRSRQARRVVESPGSLGPPGREARRLELAEALKEIEKVKRRAETWREGVAPQRAQVKRIESPTSGLPSALEVEDRESLEVAGVEAAAAPEDQDEQAERLVAQRLKEVEARNRELTDSEYTEFERKIRQEGSQPATVRESPKPRYSAQQLRDAFVWREILGPPVGLRDW